MNLYKTAAKFMSLTMLFGMVSCTTMPDTTIHNDTTGGVFVHDGKNKKEYAKQSRYDLRPYADIIVEKALKRLKETPDKPLILMLGEDHYVLSHPVIQMLVLKKLKDHGVDIAFGKEFEHNNLAKNFYRKVKGVQEKESLSAFIAENDLNGSLSLKSYIAFGNFVSNAYSHKTLLNFILKEKIPNRFNDTATIGTQLNNDDPQTKRAIKDLYPENIEDDLNVREAQAIHIRNHMMVQNAIAHTKKTRPRVYVQHCGAAHLIGSKKDQFLYQHSLTTLFKDMGYSVLVVPLLRRTLDGKNLVPPDYNLEDKEIIWLMNPPEIHNDPDIEYNAHYGQRFFIRKMMEASGLNPALVSLDDAIVQYKEEMMALFEKWKKEAGKFSANDAAPLPALAYAINHA